MGKNKHFIGHPLFTELINFLDKQKISQLSRECNGERYIKSFDCWQHLVTMLYATLARLDSLREISKALQVESNKLCHLGLKKAPARSTLSDANKRRPEEFFQKVYNNLYDTYRYKLSSDSRLKNKLPEWYKKLKIIDSTTISLFSNLIFKGVGRHPKSGKKKGGIKVHTVMYANEGVPCDIKFTSAATNDSFMLVPKHYNKDQIVALDRAYICYDKFEELTKRGVIYVTKMKKNLKYEVLSDVIYQSNEGLAKYREQSVEFHKDNITHKARIITYIDIKKGGKFVSLLTNDSKMPMEDIIDIYRCRWLIESLFKQLKQNFPLHFFYGESANAIKIQIWVTLIANFLIMLLKSRIKRRWSFSGLVSIVRITLMSYLNPYTLFENPESDWGDPIREASKSPPQLTLFD